MYICGTAYDVVQYDMCGMCECGCYDVVWCDTVCDMANMTWSVCMYVSMCMDMSGDMDMHDHVHVRACIRVYVVCAVVQYS